MALPLPYYGSGNLNTKNLSHHSERNARLAGYLPFPLGTIDTNNQSDKRAVSHNFRKVVP